MGGALLAACGGATQTTIDGGADGPFDKDGSIAEDSGVSCTPPNAV